MEDAISANASVNGYENGDIVETRTESLSYGDNYVDVGGINGSKYDIAVEAVANESETDSPTFEVRRMVYTGQLDTSFVIGAVKPETVVETVFSWGAVLPDFLANGVNAVSGALTGFIDMVAGVFSP